MQVFGASFKNIPIHKFGDASVLSFNMFKFVSSIHGGAVITKDKNLISYIESIQKDWRAFGAQDLLKYFLKGTLFRIITSKYIFNSISFKIILYATKYNIGFLKTLLINDPKVTTKKNLPKKYQRQLNVFQVKSILHQIQSLKNKTHQRKKNYLIHEKQLKNPRLTKLVKTKRYCDGGFINFPVLVKNREAFSKHLFDNNIDHSCFFYPNISKSVDKEECKNVALISSRIVFFPTHPKIELSQLKMIIRHVNSYRD